MSRSECLGHGAVRDLHEEEHVALLVGDLALGLDRIEELGCGELVEVGGDLTGDVVSVVEDAQVSQLRASSRTVHFDPGDKLCRKYRI